MSLSCFEEVSTITGMVFVFSSLFIFLSTSMPSTLGSRRSSRIILGLLFSCPAYFPCENKKSSASAPSLSQTRLLARFCFFRDLIASSASLGLSSTNKISISFISVIYQYLPSKDPEYQVKGRFGAYVILAKRNKKLRPHLPSPLPILLRRAW